MSNSSGRLVVEYVLCRAGEGCAVCTSHSTASCLMPQCAQYCTALDMLHFGVNSWQKLNMDVSLGRVRGICCAGDGFRRSGMHLYANLVGAFV